MNKKTRTELANLKYDNRLIDIGRTFTISGRIHNSPIRHSLDIRNMSNERTSEKKRVKTNSFIKYIISYVKNVKGVG